MLSAYKLQQSEVYYNAMFLSSETVSNNSSENNINTTEDVKVKL